MARKNVLSYAMLDDANLASNITSSSTNVINLDKASIHISWAGSSPVGTFTVEARNSEKDAWYTLDFGAAITVSGASGDHQLIFNDLPFYEIRLQYVATSGAGTVDAILTAKQVGG